VFALRLTRGRGVHIPQKGEKKREKGKEREREREKRETPRKICRMESRSPRRKQRAVCIRRVTAAVLTGKKEENETV